MTAKNILTNPATADRWKWCVLYIGLATGIIYALLAKRVYDDPFITYRYAENLASGLGFVYNPGERVLSTTTPLFTLILAAFYPLWPDLPHLANLIGALSLALGGLFLWNLACSWNVPALGWLGLLTYPTFLLLLTTLGSEMPLYLAFCLGAFAFYARCREGQRFAGCSISACLAAVFAALATLTRPDGLLVATVLAAHFLVSQKPFGKDSTSNLKRFAFTITLFLLLILPWFIFAWSYFGSPLPTTLLAKQQQGAMLISQRFAPGLPKIANTYARSWNYSLEALLALGGVAFAIWVRHPARLLLAWTVLYFIAYTLLGVSRYHWYYAPLVPGFITSAGLGITALCTPHFARIATRLVGQSTEPVAPRTSHLAHRTFHQRWPALLAGLLIAAIALAQARGLWLQRLFRDDRYPIYRAVGQWLQANTPPDASVGTLEVGIIGYFAQRPMIDFLGLIQPEVAAHLTPETTFQSAAQWVVEIYHPSYLVLQAGAFPELEQVLLAYGCQVVQRFPPQGADGETYSSNGTIDIYACALSV